MKSVKSVGPQLLTRINGGTGQYVRRLLIAAALLLPACYGASDNVILPPPGVGPLPTIGVLVTGSANITRGSSAQVGVTVSRSATYTGPIDLSAEGLPAGVTASFAPATVPGGSTASTLTLTATAAAALGTGFASVRAKATGLNDAVVQLVIAVSP